jgi:hypothetical protein
MSIAPRAFLIGGDRVLLCSACEGSNLRHALAGTRHVFHCDDCNAAFSMSVELREGKVCFMWQWESEQSAA